LKRRVGHALRFPEIIIDQLSLDWIKCIWLLCTIYTKYY
jgi:hypothetical protein